MRSILLSFLLCLVAVCGGLAQGVTYTFSSPTVCPGTNEVTVDVSVTDFTNVQGAQFTVGWDPAVLGVDPSVGSQGHHSYNLPGLDVGDFSYGNMGNNYAQAGYFTFAWFATGQNASAGETVPDGTVIFSITFGVLSPATSTVGTIASPTPTGTFVNFATVPSVIVPGTVTTEDTVAPTFACPATTVQATAAVGSTSAVVSNLASGATDNCVLASVSYQTAGATNLASPTSGINDISGETFSVGTTTVMYTAFDLEDNSSTCSFDVEVLPASGGPSTSATFDVRDGAVDCVTNAVNMDVRVTGFDDVVAYSGTIVFDPAELSFDPNTTLINVNPSSPNVVLNTAQAAQGVVTFSAVATNNIPFTIADGERLFTIPLTYVSGVAPTVVINGSVSPLTVAVNRGGTLTTIPSSATPGSVIVVDLTPPALVNCPADIDLDVSPGTCSATLNYTAPTATDACDGAPVVTLTSGPASGSVLPQGSTVVVYTATDASGNSATCSFTVTVSDDEAPAFQGCPADQTVVTAGNTCDATATWTVPAASDNCSSTVAVSASHNPGDAFGIGTTTVTYTATDDAGNTGVCSFAITVTDGQVPTFDLCPANQSYAVDPGSCTYAGVIVTPTATDDCSSVTVVQTGGPASPLPVGANVLTFTATDLSGNTATCAFTVVVEDLAAPTVGTCPGDIVVDAAANLCGASVSWTVPTFADACGTPAVTSTHQPGDAFAVGTTTVTYTATDDSGNTAVCAFDVTVNDTGVPTFSDCPTAALVVSAAAGDCEAAVTFATPVATDACSSSVNVTQTAGPASGTPFPVGTTSVTFTAEDAAGNSAVCTFDVTVTDDEQPVVVCPADQTGTALPGSTALTFPGLAPTATDNCPVSTIGYDVTGATTTSGADDASDLAFNVGTSTVVYTATDASGNVGTCSFTVVVNPPAGAPDITCPADVQVDAQTNQCSATVLGLEVAIASPATTIASTSFALAGATTGSGSGSASGRRFNIGTTVITYTVTGTNGQSATCTTEVVVRDVDAPSVLACPGDQSINTIPGLCQASTFWQPPVFRDACGPVTVTTDVDPGSLLPVGANTVTYTATDASGNTATCAFVVTVLDLQDPTLGCPMDRTITVPAGRTSVVIGSLTPIVNDNCGLASVTYAVSGATTATGADDASGTTFALGTSIVTYTATDISGNTATCQTTINVSGPDGPPMFTCPADVSVTAATGACDATVNDLAIDISTPASQVQSVEYEITGATTASGTDDASGTRFAVGVSTVTYTVTGTNGESATCQITVTVTSGDAITVDNCPANIAVAADANACVADDVQWTAPAFSDSCETPTVTSTHAPGDAFPAGTTTVTYTATTSDGRTATCSFDVVVSDVTPPTLVDCPGDIMVMASGARCDAEASWPQITATDACDGPLVATTDFASGATFPVGVTTVTATAVDAAGNVATCSFNVTVVAGTGVAVDCPADISYRTDGQLVSDDDNFVRSGFSAGCDELFLDFDLPSATSSCGAVAVQQVSGLPSGSRFPIGVTTLVFEAMTLSGTAVQCSVNVEILPEETLALSADDASPCEGEDVVLTVSGPRNAAYDWTGPNGFASTRQQETLVSVSSAEGGVYSVTSTTDGGCQQAATLTLDVGGFPAVDIVTPDFVCGQGGGDLVLQATITNGVTGASYRWNGPNGYTSTDETPIIPDASPALSGTYTVTVTSANGCSGTASKTIEVGEQPDAPNVVVSDITPCLDTEVILTGSGYSAASVGYNWTVTPTAGARLNPVNFVAVFQADVAGAYEVCYSVDVDGCSTQVVCNTINVEAAPAINLSGRDSIACTDGTRDLTLTETAGQAATYRWVGPNGSVLSNLATLNVANVTSGNSGVYSLRATSANGCVADTAVNVTITDRPDAPTVQTDDAMLCLGATATLQSTVLGPNTDYRWTASQGAAAGIPALNNVPVLSVQPTEVGTYIYELRADRDGCLSDAVTATVVVMDNPAADAELLGDTDCIIGSTTLTLDGQAAAGLTYAWTGPNGYTSDELSPTLTVDGEDANGTYELLVTNAANCSSEATIEVDVTRGVAQLSTFFDGDLCRGETIQLFANEVAGATYAWTGPNDFASNAQNPVINSLTPSFSGSYEAVARLSNGCESAPSAPLDLAILADPEAIADRFEYVLGQGTLPLEVLANDQLDTEDFTITLTRDAVFGEAVITADGVINYVSAADLPQSDRIEYEVCYTECPELCARALVNIDLDYSREECIVMTVISPNGDGLNDELYISCVDDPQQNPDNSLQIFNEWGDEVFAASPYRNDWQGMREGEDLPDGTYYYVFRASANAEQQRGAITIFR